MKIGVSAFAWNFRFHAAQIEVVRGLKEQGIDGFEVPVFEPEAVDVKALRKGLEAEGLEPTVCAILPEGVNPISPDADVRAKSLNHLRRVAEITAALGATRMGGPVFAPIGYLPGRKRTSDEWNWAIECFHKLDNLLQALGVELALEPVNRSETFLVTTAADGNALVDAIGSPRIGVLIDTFHANIEEKNVVDAVASVGKRMKHVHISENHRGVPGTGHIHFPGIVAALKANDYDGYLMIEGFGFDPKYTHDKIWRDEAIKPLDIALGGATYLRSLLA